MPNRTVAARPEGAAAEFCDVQQDLEAALEFVLRHGLARRVIVWGSSYSAALVFRLAAEHPDRVVGLLPFSPASGGPMAACRAREWLDRLTVPAAVFRPAAEMARASSIKQRPACDTARMTRPRQPRPDCQSTSCFQSPDLS